MITVRPALASDQYDLLNINHACFDDPPEFWSLFRSTLHRPDCLVAEIDGKVAASVYVYPFEWVSGLHHFRCSYVYALGTLPEYRRHGAASALLEKIWQQGVRDGIHALLLVPAYHTLFPYYERHGYETVTSISEQIITPKMVANPLKISAVHAEDYFRIREKKLLSFPHGSWTPQILSFQQEASRLCNGGLYQIGDGQGCCVLESEEDTLICKELLISSDLLQRAAAGLAALYPGKKKLSVRVPAEYAGFPARPFAMARYIQPDAPAVMRGGYFSLCFD